MESNIYVTRVGHNSVTGDIHKLRYERGEKYDNIMKRVRDIAVLFGRGKIVCESNYAHDTYDASEIPIIEYFYDPKEDVQSIKDELQEILDSGRDEWFWINYSLTKAATKDQHLHMFVEIGGRS